MSTTFVTIVDIITGDTLTASSEKWPKTINSPRIIDQWVAFLFLANTTFTNFPTSRKLMDTAGHCFFGGPRSSRLFYEVLTFFGSHWLTLVTFGVSKLGTFLAVLILFHVCTIVLFDNMVMSKEVWNILFFRRVCRWLCQRFGILVPYLIM